MDTLKRIGKFVFWLVLILVGISLLFTGVGTLAEKFNWKIGNKTEVKVDNLENGMSEGVFGDYTYDEVNKVQIDVDAPTYPDIMQQFIVQDLGNYVVIYREAKDNNGNTIYPNLLFAKTANGLVWDGAIGINCTVDTNWWSGKQNLDNPDFTLSNKIEVYEFEDSNWYGGALAGLSFGLYSINNQFDHSNIVTFSDFQIDFCTDFYNMNSVVFGVKSFNKEERVNRLYNSTRYYLVNNVVIPYFFELMEGAQMFVDKSNLNTTQYDVYTLGRLNAYCTYLYNYSKDLQNDEYKLLSLNNYFLKPIPTDEISNYPVPENKQAEYNGKKYYLAYNCDIFAKTYFIKQPTNIKRDIEKVEKTTTEIYIEKPITVNKVYSTLTVSLNNKQNSDLTHLNLTNNPVTIDFGDKKLTFNTIDLLSKSQTIVLEKNKTYNYKINSNELVFDNYSGSFKLTENAQSLNFDYSYLYGYVSVGVGLNPITSTNAAGYDLSKNPVKIVLVGINGEGTYELVFDDNSKVLKLVNFLIKKGAYTYSILSDSLIFSSTTGEMIISNDLREFWFNFAIPGYTGDFNVSLTIESHTTDVEDYVFGIELSKNLVSKLNDVLGENYTQRFSVIDENNNVVYSSEILRGSSNGPISLTSFIAELLDENKDYKVHTVFFSDTNDELFLVLPIAEFTYTPNTAFEFNYDIKTFN